MKTALNDYNSAAKVIDDEFGSEWGQLKDVLVRMPLHVKASDQAGLKGNPIFDPVGTNEHIKAQLLAVGGWSVNVPIPREYDFLGTDVDFEKGGLLVEAQFSNYPFLLNNLLRSELFYQGKVALTADPVRAVVIITKGHIFPASNSTLYFEQAKKQLSALAEKNVFDVPIRLVGLVEDPGETIAGTWTSYHNPRYSRTAVERKNGFFQLSPPKTTKGRAKLVLVPPVPK